MTPIDTVPERRLMQAVILSAIADACGQSTDTCRPCEQEAHQRRALNWIADAGSDFRQVCELAGLHPDMVRKFALEYIESGKPLPRIPRADKSGQQRRHNPMSFAAIAARAGVSASTVCQVMGKDKGSVEIKARVHKAARAIAAEQGQAA